MKAMVFLEYGTPDVLMLKNVHKPVPRDNEVLIKVKASSINDWDWGLLRGVPYMNRLLFGRSKPKMNILGSDVAGIVESIGKDVTSFQPCDEVFGDLCGSGKRGWGGFAEYDCAREEELTLKPATMSFEQAAAIPQAAVLALQGLRKGQLQAGQKVLINGAAGGTGSFAVQMAKQLGAEVTAVGRSSQFDMLRSIGADYVIDFSQEDFIHNGQDYDLILDLMAQHSVFDCMRALSHNGRYVMVGGASSSIIQMLLLGPFLSLFGKKKMHILAHKPNKGLRDIIEMFESGKLTPIIDQCFPLSETANAFRHFGEGHKKGKIVISVA